MGCAVQVQQQVPAYNADQPPDRTIRFRIGINIGYVISEGTNLHGDGVNVAVRLQAECPPGGICVSRSVRDHVIDRLKLAFEERGSLNLKNISRPVEAFVLRLGTELSTALPASMRDFDMPKAPRLSLVVLPFVNLSGNRNEDYLADAITEELTTDLAYLPDTLVIARHTAASYRDQPINMRRIGRELGVRYVIEGSVRKLGDTLRVNVQLIAAETDIHVWAGRFDQALTDLDVDLEAVVSRLREVLGMRMFDAESARSVRERPDNLNASDLLLRGWSAAQKAASPSHRAHASAFYEQALKVDPLSARAMCHLAVEAINSFVIPDYPSRDDENLIERAAGLVATAAAIEPDSQHVMYAQGFLLRAQGKWAEAITTLQRLIELYPNALRAYRLLGFSELSIGRPAAAVAWLQRAIRVDPLFPFNRHSYQRMGIALLLLGHDQASIDWHQRALAADATAPPAWRAQCHLFIASAFALRGQFPEAHSALAEAECLWPFATVQSLPPTMTPRGLPHPAYLMQMRRVQEGLRLAGLRHHADEDTDLGVMPGRSRKAELVGWTPTTVPGAFTLRTHELVDLMARQSPILIDVALDSWGKSMPGAIGLQGLGNGTAFSDTVHQRFRRKMCDLTKSDLLAPIVVFCVNSERFTGYNLALRLVALGYTEVYWYRGGVEAWQAERLPEADLALHGW